MTTGYHREDLEAPSFDAILEGVPPAEEYEPTDSDMKLSEALVDRFRSMEDARYYYEKNWDLYNFYLKGEQLLIHRSTGELIKLAPEDNRRLRSINNQLRPTHRSFVAKLSRSIPGLKVMPATADFPEQHGAKTATSLLKYFERSLKMEIKYIEMNDYLGKTGNAYLEVGWDRLGGNVRSGCEVCDYMDEEAMIGEECPHCALQREQELMQQAQLQQAYDFEAATVSGMTGEMQPAQVAELQQMGPLPADQEPPDMVAYYEGEVFAKVRDPWGFFIEPGADCLEEARYVCYRDTLPVSDVREMFPEMAAFIDVDEAVEANKNINTTHTSYDTYGEAHDYSEHVDLYTWHEKPTLAYPEGRMIWTYSSEHKVLRAIAHPYYKELGRFPFFVFGFDKNAREFYCEPPITNAWHRQRELNVMDSSKREHVEVLSKSKVFVSNQARVSPDDFDNNTSQIIGYSGGPQNIPKPWDPPPIPTDVWNRSEELKQDIRSFYGITDQEAGLGSADPNGRAMAILEAESDQQLAPITTRNNDEWREAYRALLIVALQNYSEDRVWTISGPDGTEQYHIQNLNLNPGWDVVLETTDGFSRNPVLRRQQALELFNAGYYIDPMTGLNDTKQFARDAGMKVPEAGYDIEATERARAAAIPEMLRQGEIYQPRTFDDVEIFAEVLAGWLRGSVMHEDPNLVGAVEAVYQYYLIWLVTQQMPGSPGFGGMQPNADGTGFGGPDQSAPGGTPNNPGMMGTDTSISGQSSQMVSQADNAAESMAQTQSNREG